MQYQKIPQTKRKPNKKKTKPNQSPPYMKWIYPEQELSQAVIALLIQATYKYSNLQVLGAIFKCQEVCQVLNTQVYIFNCQQPKYPRQETCINSSSTPN